MVDIMNRIIFNTIEQIESMSKEEIIQGLVDCQIEGYLVDKDAVLKLINKCLDREETIKVGLIQDGFEITVMVGVENVTSLLIHDYSTIYSDWFMNVDGAKSVEFLVEDEENFGYYIENSNYKIFTKN